MKNKSKKKKIITLVALIVLAAVVLILGTFAYWQVTKKQTNRNRLGSACLKITLTNETDDIDLPSMYPTSELDVLLDSETYKPYTFTVENICDEGIINYTVALESVLDEETNENDYLNYNYVRVKLDDFGSSVYSGLEAMPSDSYENSDPDPAKRYYIRDTKKIITRKLGPNSSRTHELRLWLDKDTPLEETNNNAVVSNMNKYFFGKIKITGGQGIEEECYAVNSAGELYSYDSDCGRSATIPATVNNIPVKTIKSEAFKGNFTFENIEEYPYVDDNNNEFADIAAVAANDWGTLNGENGDITGRLDFIVVWSKKLSMIGMEDPSLGEMTEAEQAEFVGSMGPNDLTFIKYNTDSTSTQYSHLDDVIEAMQEEYTSMLDLGIDFTEGTVYTYGVDAPAIPSDALVQTFALSHNGEDWIATYLAQRLPASVTTTTSALAIDSLDLSEATNLELIEAAAFMNVPHDVIVRAFSGDNVTLDNIPTGLTELNFGDPGKTKPIELESEAFAGADLDELTVYTGNYIDLAETTHMGGKVDVTYGDNGAGGYAVFNMPFITAKIGTLNVVKYQNNTSYNAHVLSIDSNTTTPIFGMADIDNVIIGDGITDVGDRAFAGTDINSSITLPDGLLTIGDEGFKSYRGSSLTLPNSLTTIGEDAFYWWNATTDLTIPAGVTYIGETAFGRLKGTITVNNSCDYVKEHFDQLWHYYAASDAATVTYTGGACTN